MVRFHCTSTGPIGGLNGEVLLYVLLLRSSTILE